VLLLAAVGLMAWGCSDRLVDEAEEMSVQIPLSAELLAAKPMVAADEFQLTVTDHAADSVLAQVSLALNRTVLEGSVEDLPAGRPLTFLVEAMDSENGVVIYRGSATAIVAANKTITLNIPLAPVVPLLRFTPRFVQLHTDSSFVLDTWVENVDSLFGISFRVLWPVDFPLRVDSAQAGADVNSPGIIFFAQPGAGSYHTFSVTQTGAGEAIVGPTGKAHLARVYFTVEDPASVWDSRIGILLEPTGLTGVDSTIIPIEDIYADDCTLEVGASGGK